MAALCAVCWQVLSAAAVPYDIVYVRAPRAGDNTHTRWAEVARPMFVEPGSDLVLLHPDGTEEVLVAAGKGAVADPCVSFDAQWIYYSYFPDLSTYWVNGTTPLAGADVYQVNLASRQIVQLTHGEYTPNTSVRTSPLPYGIFNMGPCPVAGGKVVFTSNRNGFIPPKQYTPVTSQLFIMNEDGSDVRPIAPMTLGAALHPFQLKDGRIAFSTQEAQGLRDQRAWALWAIWPDGRHWEPLHSAFISGSAFHFATQLSQGDIVVEDYYNLNNLGFGTFHRFPTNVPAPRFYSARRTENPPAVYTNVNGVRSALYYPFAPVGFQTITPFSTMIDQSSGLVSAGSSDRLGKVTHPSAAPNNDLLLVYASGPVNLLARPVNLPAPDAGIYLARNGGPVERPGDLVLVKNDPLYNEIWPRAVVPYRAIYGVDQPHVFPFLPNDGTAHPALPAGTPYGIIGTSSLYKRESAPGWATPGVNYDGIEPFNAPGEDVNPGWGIQGSDAGKISNSDIAAVRIVMLEPQTEMSGQGTKQFFNHVNERMRILGEIPVRKTNADGSPVLDPEGNPDTSFWAKIPADTPITFQMLDKDSRVLTMAQTWHQVRPGEVRVDCGGCHAHSQVPLAFERTAAARMPPTDLTLQPAHDVEYVRDIEPLVQAKCVSCHRGENAPALLRLDRDTATNYSVLANNQDSQYGGIKPPAGAFQTWLIPNVSRYVRVLQSRRSLLMWKLAGARLDGWTNEQWPTTIFANPTEARYLFDLDYERGTVDHAVLLTDEEKRRVAAWIDLAAPLDLGGGYWRDEIRPTLAITVVAGELLIGAADGYSGLDASSLSVTVNGVPAELHPRDNGIWAVPSPPPGAAIVARVKDRAGNLTQLTSRVATTATALLSGAPLSNRPIPAMTFHPVTDVLSAVRPSAPSVLLANTVGTGVVLTWAEPDTGTPMAYAIAWGTVPGASTLPVQVVEGTTTRFEVPSLPDGTYYFRVHAAGTSDLGPPSQQYYATVTSSVAPGPPVALQASVSGGGIRANWRAPLFGATPTLYEVQIGSAPGKNDIVSEMRTATSFTATLRPGSYWLRTRAATGAAVGAWSNSVQITVGAGGCGIEPGVPIMLPVAAASGLVTFTWWPTGSAADTYQVQITPDGLLGPTTFLNTSGAAAGLVWGQMTGAFSARVVATNRCGGSAPSSSVGFSIQ